MDEGPPETEYQTQSYECVSFVAFRYAMILQHMRTCRSLGTFGQCPPCPPGDCPGHESAPAVTNYGCGDAAKPKTREFEAGVYAWRGDLDENAVYACNSWAE